MFLIAENIAKTLDFEDTLANEKIPLVAKWHTFMKLQLHIDATLQT